MYDDGENEKGPANTKEIVIFKEETREKKGGIQTKVFKPLPRSEGTNKGDGKLRVVRLLSHEVKVGD